MEIFEIIGIPNLLRQELYSNRAEVVANGSTSGTTGLHPHANDDDDDDVDGVVETLKKYYGNNKQLGEISN